MNCCVWSLDCKYVDLLYILYAQCIQVLFSVPINLVHSPVYGPESRFCSIPFVKLHVNLHSDAQEECIFLMTQKNKIAFRPNLDPKGTLSSILTIKLAKTGPANSFEEVLKKAKSTTWEYNKAHRRI